MAQVDQPGPTDQYKLLNWESHGKKALIIQQPKSNPLTVKGFKPDFASVFT
jgi:hypothetical protein